MKPSDYAWVTLGAGVLAWDVLCPKGELLSQAVDRYRQHRPWLTHLVIIYVALHLTRTWPRRIDPLHQLSNRLGR